MTEKLCPLWREGWRTTHWPGTRDQCPGCGRIVYTREDGTCRPHDKPKRGLTPEQKEALAVEVMDRMATLAEFSDEMALPVLQEADPRDIRDQLARWAKRLPTGGVWDWRLGDYR